MNQENEVVVRHPDDVKKLAELGILRAMPVLKVEGIQAGRLLRRMMNLQAATTNEMLNVKNSSKIYLMHKPTITTLLGVFQDLTDFMKSDTELHLTANFCLKLVENSKFEYSQKITEALKDIVEYYSRADVVPDNDHEKKCEEVIEVWNSIVVRPDGDLESPYLGAE